MDSLLTENDEHSRKEIQELLASRHNTSIGVTTIGSKLKGLKWSYGKAWYYAQQFFEEEIKKKTAGPYIRDVLPGKHCLFKTMTLNTQPLMCFSKMKA
ncbi:hypothetical protein UPYG_G00026820 [Umbra pygmaea]|uniref:Uncharacterized protein n=1 Tax=Umbra pygmaea TaxID=75934 RepID=A0ABD0Y945_UMBPY